MKKSQAYDRRGVNRRHIDLGPPPHIDERRHQPPAHGQSHASATPWQRRQGERRKGERRQVDLGPPPGIGERRFQPDPRGVVFLYPCEDDEPEDE